MLRIVNRFPRLCKIHVIRFDLRLDARSEVFPAGGGRLQGDLLFSADRQVDLGRVRKQGNFCGKVQQDICECIGISHRCSEYHASCPQRVQRHRIGSFVFLPF